MRDFPVFATSNGVASLVLKEVPYKGTAYITLHDTHAPETLLAECVGFCKMAGAERVFAAGSPVLEDYTLHTTVFRMRCLRVNLPEGTASLFPVTEKTLEHWRELYNEKMKNVPNSATITRMDAKNYLNKAYFVHRDGVLLGIGAVEGECVEAVIALVPGAGEEVLLTLFNAIAAEQVVLEVASANWRAVRLYESLGFIPSQELSRWYDVTNLR